MSLKSVAEEYFRSMNPLAEKMYEDIDEVRDSYENIWNTLSETEKMEILNESIIKPDILLQYALLDNLDFDLNDPPIRQNDLMSFFGREHGLKLIHDENTNTAWRDEHSAPFLFQTKSQLNLCDLSGARGTKDIAKSTSPNPITELEMSHSKVVSELKNALKKQELRSTTENRETMSPTNLLSKFMNNFKAKDDESEFLVTRDIDNMMSSATSNLFASIFTSPQKEAKNGNSYRSSVAKSNSDLSEENHGLLSNASLGSSGTDFLSCDGSPDRTKSTDTLTKTGASRCGFDFLDNCGAIALRS